QAEDGIRCRNVTGVQTCALPISVKALSISSRWHSLHDGTGRHVPHDARTGAHRCARPDPEPLQHTRCRTDQDFTLEVALPRYRGDRKSVEQGKRFDRGDTIYT